MAMKKTLSPCCGGISRDMGIGEAAAQPRLGERHAARRLA